MTNREFLKWGEQNGVRIQIKEHEGVPVLWASIGNTASFIPLDANIGPRIAYLCYCIKEGQQHGSERGAELRGLVAERYTPQVPGGNPGSPDEGDDGGAQT